MVCAKAAGVPAPHGPWKPAKRSVGARAADPGHRLRKGFKVVDKQFQGGTARNAVALFNGKTNSAITGHMKAGEPSRPMKTLSVSPTRPGQSSASGHRMPTRRRRSDGRTAGIRLVLHQDLASDYAGSGGEPDACADQKIFHNLRRATSPVDRPVAGASAKPARPVLLALSLTCAPASSPLLAEIEERVFADCATTSATGLSQGPVARLTDPGIP